MKQDETHFFILVLSFFSLIVYNIWLHSLLQKQPSIYRSCPRWSAPPHGLLHDWDLCKWFLYDCLTDSVCSYINLQVIRCFPTFSCWVCMRKWLFDSSQMVYWNDASKTWSIILYFYYLYWLVSLVKQRLYRGKCLVVAHLTSFFFADQASRRIRGKRLLHFVISAYKTSEYFNFMENLSIALLKRLSL